MFFRMFRYFFTNFIFLKCILNVYLTHSLCGLVQGLIAGDSISPDKQEVSGKEGASATLRCSYETSEENVRLYWYSHRSNQAPQFILYIGARSLSRGHISDRRCKSTTSRTSTELTITQLTLADTALYYCALDNTVIQSVEEPLHKPDGNDLPILQRGGKWQSHHHSIRWIVVIHGLSETLWLHLLMIHCIRTPMGTESQ